MKYLILMIDGKEQPIIVGKGIDTDVLAKLVEATGAKIVSGGNAAVQEMIITCQGTITVNGKEVVSRGLKDEVILRSSDFID